MEGEFNKQKIFYDAIMDIINESENSKKPQPDYPKVPFDIPSSFEIIDKASSILKEEPAVLQINTKEDELDFVIAGDIHGSIDSIIRIFKEKGYPPKTRYLFLGDYVDRGFRSCDVLILLYSLKCLFPNDIYLIRGNHEFKNMTDHYGFKTECFKRVKTTFRDDICYTAFSFYRSITETFQLLPICAILDDSIFCVHGGITSFIKNREELLKINKVSNQFFESDLVQAEMLWNDPDKFTITYSASNRGRGSVFGEQAVESFLKNMDFKLVIRGHQNMFNGFDWPFGQKGGILTVFSAIDYCKTSNNGGVAIIIKEKELENIDESKLVNVHQIDNYPRYEGYNHCFSLPLQIDGSY